MSSTSAADRHVGDRPTRHFVVVKRGGFSRDGIRLSARQSAFSLLDCGIWPLWSHTRNRKAITAGDRLAVYLSGDGDGQVVATATVRQVGPWTRSVASAYPLDLDGIPFVVLHLQHVEVLQQPVEIKRRLKQLSFINQHTPKWGVAFMGGSRAVSGPDYDALTTH